MTQTGITGGLVSVEDGIKKAEEYAPPRKVRVELHFEVPEGADATEFLGTVSARADNQVKALLGQKIVATATSASQKLAGGDAKPVSEMTDKDRKAAEAGVLVVEEPKKPEGIKRGPARPAAAKKDEPASLPRGGLMGEMENGKVPAMKSAQIDLEDLTGPTPQPEAKVEPPDDDELFSSSPVTEVTDQQLTDAVTDRNKDLGGKARVNIRTLIGSFNPDPTRAFTIKEIAQAQRGDFLEKLKTIEADKGSA